jgi:RHS repeat-associated protein
LLPIQAHCVHGYTLDVVGGLPEVIQAGTNRYLQVGGQLLAQTSAGNWQYIHPDHLGSVRQMSDATGVVGLGQDYDPFGNLVVAYGAETSAFGYTGEGADESGLLCLRARYYDAETGRFLSQDPFEGTLEQPYSQHLYQYSYSNPVRYTDPSGQCISITNALWAMVSPDMGEFAVMRGPGSLSLAETQALQAECVGNLTAAGAQWAEGDLLSAGIYAAGTAAEVRGAAETHWSAHQALLTTYDPDTTWQERFLPAAEVTVFSLSWAPAPGSVGIASYADDISRKGSQIFNSVSSCVDDLLQLTGRAAGGRSASTANAFGVLVPRPSGIAGIDDAAGYVDDVILGPSNRRLPASALSQPCGCFSADTEVLTDEGAVEISEIEVGDLVWAWNESLDENGFYTVTDVFVQVDEVLVYVTIDGELVQTTPEHPFYTNADGWVAAKDLVVGNRIPTTDGAVGIVQAVEVVNRSQPMFNLTVVGDSTPTTIERDSFGVPTAVVSPFNQTTTLTLNNGYLTAIQNPAQETSRFTYTLDGLLTNMVTPRNEVYTYTYNSSGRLIRDENPVGGYKDLQRYHRDSVMVELTNALGDEATFYNRVFRNGISFRRIEGPNGFTSWSKTSVDGSTTLTVRGEAPDVVLTTTTTYAPDPRWQMASPYISETLTRDASGEIIYDESRSREVTLADPSDPLSLEVLTDVVTINGRSTTQVYDRDARTLVISEPSGNVTVTTFDVLGRPSLVTRTNRDSITYEYGVRGQLIKITEGTRITEMTYDPVTGYLLSVEDPEGGITSYERDEVGRVLTETLPTLHTLGYAYDLNGNLAYFTDTRNVVTHYQYDAHDRLITTTVDVGNPVAGHRNVVSVNTYDLADNLTARRSDVGTGRANLVARYDYVAIDASLNYLVATMTDTANQPTSYTYTPLGKVEGVTNARGYTTAYTYTEEGWLGQLQTPDGVTTYQYYGASPTPAKVGMLRQVIDPRGVATKYDYDTATGWLVSVTEGVTTVAGSVAVNQVTTFDYNVHGQILTTTQGTAPNITVRQYVYDRAGNLVAQRDATGSALCFDYDALNRVSRKHAYVSISDPLNVVDEANGYVCNNFGVRRYEVQTTYGTNGGSKGYRTGLEFVSHHSTFDNSEGGQGWTYDARGRVTSETTRITYNSATYRFKFGYDYDAADRVRTVYYPDDSPLDTTPGYSETVTYQYTDPHQMLLRGTQGVSTAHGTVNYLTNRQYNHYGQITQQTYGTTPSAIQSTSYWPLNTPNGQGRVQGVLTTVGLAYRQNVGYHVPGNPGLPGYDAVGNILTIVDANATGGTQTQNMQYDALDRLQRYEAGGGTGGTWGAQWFEYDEHGNLTFIKNNNAGGSIQRTYGNGAQRTQAQGCANGALNPAHATTTITDTVTTHYCYNVVGNMVERQTGSVEEWLVYDMENRLTNHWNSSGTINATFAYNGDGARVRSTINGVTTLYAGAIEYEIDGSTTTLTKYYDAGGQRVAVRNGASLNFLLNDHLGSTSIMLKTNGSLWGELRYSAWGETRYSNGNIVTDRQYTGQINDGATGLYYYNARYYDPALHKFIQADTIVPDPNDPQTLNRYSYVNNNPVRYTDPTGHEAETQCATEYHDCISWTLEQWLAYGLVLTRESSCTPGPGYCNWTDLAHENVLKALNLIKVTHGMDLIEAIFAHPDGGKKLTISLDYNFSAGSRAYADVIDNKMVIHKGGIPSLYDIVHEIGHFIDFRAGRNQTMYSSGGVFVSEGLVPRSTTGGYWTAKVPGWAHDSSSETGWSLPNLAGTADDRAERAPYEDFAWTFTWSVMRMEYNYPSQARRDALDATLDIATRR